MPPKYPAAPRSARSTSIAAPSSPGRVIDDPRPFYQGPSCGRGRPLIRFDGEGAIMNENPPAAETPRPTHRLAGEKSPYLPQHATNPVDWYPGGDEAFGKARSEAKPVFLSIGYSTCHWCHVMERESFEDRAVAELLNQHFVPIKVDREERPDVDRLYMTAAQAMGLGGGWPLNMFLTPDLKPFFGGTYFPPESRFGHPGFRQVL